jgi:CHAT domain-containing protein
MAALQDRESGRFLIEKHPLAVTPGLTLTEPRPIGSAQVELLAAGITQSVHGFPALASVASELEAARGAFAHTASLVDQQYTAESLRAELSGRPFGIVHIASHGEFHADVAQSFLLTFDGRLTMDQLASMVELTQQREHPVELLTLSACSTAAGDERAALGLAGVAVRAGARSALATLWSVNDEAAAELIGAFYRKLGEGGLSRARALQQAQLELLGERSLRHPFYWAPFVLINSWL